MEWPANTLASIISELNTTEWMDVVEVFPIVVLLGTLVLFVVLLIWALILYGKMCNPNGKLTVACECAALTVLFHFISSSIVLNPKTDFASETSALKSTTLLRTLCYALLIFILAGGVHSLLWILSLPSPHQGILSLFQCAKIGSPIPNIDRVYNGAIYLDYNGTTPVFSEVARAMVPYLGQCWGNPSTPNIFGRRCSEGLSRARNQIASLLGCSPEEVTFVSCGTEANNWAIQGAIHFKSHEVPPTGRPHVIASSIEHPSVMKCLAEHAKNDEIDVTLVPVSNEGIVSAADVMEVIRPTTILVTIMNSNNEINTLTETCASQVGSIQPIKKIAQHCRRKGILFHTDAAQSVGKVPVRFGSLGVDMLTGHKFGAPKGIGALILRKGLSLPPLLIGGGQEAGLRSGTENVMMAVGMGAAAQIVASELEITALHMRNMRDRLATKLLTALGPELEQRVVRVGPEDDAYSLPNTLGISIRGISASTLQMDLKDSVALSCGSACHGCNVESPVLKAMAIDSVTVRGFLRISTGRHTTAQDVDRGAELIAAAARSQLSTSEH